MVEEGGDLIRRFYETVWTRGDLDAAGEFLADDLVDHNALQFPGRAPGAGGLVQVIRMIRGAIPDLERSVEDQFGQGDRVVTRFVDRGTHQGELMGVFATGREVAVRGINIELVRGGRIREIWHLEDMMGLMQQLGVAPGSAG